MANCKVASAYILVCSVVACQLAHAKPLDFDFSGGQGLSNAKLMQALSKHSSNNLSGKLDRIPLSLQDLIASQKAAAYYQTGVNEAPKMPSEDDSASQYSPLEQLLMQKVLSEYENNEDYYQDQANNDNGLFYADGQDGWFEGPVVPQANSLLNDAAEEEFNKMLANYLLSQYRVLGESEADDEDSNVEKRRQKIVIKDDFTELSSPSTPVASTASPRKAKNTKAAKANFEKSKLSKLAGQKEFAIMRPAEPKWPSELEENNLSEEESLKQLPMRGQSRPVRDVLTSQLDSLKAEAQLQGAEKSTKKN